MKSKGKPTALIARPAKPPLPEKKKGIGQNDSVTHGFGSKRRLGEGASGKSAGKYRGEKEHQNWPRSAAKRGEKTKGPTTPEAKDVRKSKSTPETRSQSGQKWNLKRKRKTAFAGVRGFDPE